MPYSRVSIFSLSGIAYFVSLISCSHLQNYSSERIPQSIKTAELSPKFFQPSQTVSQLCSDLPEGTAVYVNSRIQGANETVQYILQRRDRENYEVGIFIEFNLAGNWYKRNFSNEYKSQNVDMQSKMPAKVQDCLDQYPHFLTAEGKSLRIMLVTEQDLTQYQLDKNKITSQVKFTNLGKGKDGKIGAKIHIAEPSYTRHFICSG